MVSTNVTGGYSPVRVTDLKEIQVKLLFSKASLSGHNLWKNQIFLCIHIWKTEKKLWKNLWCPPIISGRNAHLKNHGKGVNYIKLYVYHFFETPVQKLCFEATKVCQTWIGEEWGKGRPLVSTWVTYWKVFMFVWIKKNVNYLWSLNAFFYW